LVMERRSITLSCDAPTSRSGLSGPVLVLIHGITASAATWDDVLPWLAERHTVVAPDLLGHGRSAKPRGDYSLGAYANGIRDLLEVLGHPRATIVGHSLGGGIAMQFAYQYPERCERLVLVSSGGLGREVHAMIRAAALPGSEWVLPLICTRGLLDAVDGVARFVGRAGLRAAPDLAEIWRGSASLGDAAGAAGRGAVAREAAQRGGDRARLTHCCASGGDGRRACARGSGHGPAASRVRARGVLATRRCKSRPGKAGESTGRSAGSAR